jgi:hypothetical protein
MLGFVEIDLADIISGANGADRKYLTHLVNAARIVGECSDSGIVFDEDGKLHLSEPEMHRLFTRSIRSRLMQSGVSIVYSPTQVVWNDGGKIIHPATMVSLTGLPVTEVPTDSFRVDRLAIHSESSRIDCDEAEYVAPIIHPEAKVMSMADRTFVSVPMHHFQDFAVAQARGHVDLNAVLSLESHQNRKSLDKAIGLGERQQHYDGKLPGFIIAGTPEMLIPAGYNGIVQPQVMLGGKIDNRIRHMPSFLLDGAGDQERKEIRFEYLITPNFTNQFGMQRGGTAIADIHANQVRAIIEIVRK